MTRAPAVIAHRGASGYLPEHTREAKVLAYGQGADFVEQDVVATRDGHLVVLHDLFLDQVTDVAARFPGRARDDGRHYVIDFDLDEIKALRVRERRRPDGPQPLFPERFRDDAVAFRVATLDEELRLVQELNRETGRNVGICPEIKHPDFHRRHGIDLARRLLETLAAFGYRSAEDRVFVQCFDASELKRCREALGTRLRLAQLVEDDRPFPDPGALAEIASYAEILGPHFAQLVDVRRAGEGVAVVETADTALAAATAGLELYPYTFRRDQVPAFFPTFEALLAFFFEEVAVSGVFCDHPDIAVRVRDGLARRTSGERGEARR
ncbi:MAG TPA: glycerophosphodiester phosphodiesterase [Gammaproteobacteria bacterium]